MNQTNIWTKWKDKQRRTKMSKSRRK